MNRSDLTAIAIITALGIAITPTAASAGNGNAIGAGLLGLGVGAIVGSALTPREVYVVPSPPPPPAYYGPAAYYGPQPWSPGWYRYCRRMYGPSFNPNTGYFRAADGGWYFCQ
jgi:hypothetical protein